MTMYCAVHGPIPGSSSSWATVPAGSPPGSSRSFPDATARATPRMQPARAATMPSERDLVHAGGGHPLRHRAQTIEPGHVGHDRLAEALRKPARDGGSGADRHLLAQNGANRELESVERARHAEPRVRRDGVGEERVFAQVILDHIGPRGKIEQMAKAAEQGGKRGHERAGQLHLERAARRGVPHPDPAGGRAEPDSPRVRVVFDDLHTLERAPAEEVQQCPPVEGWPPARAAA